MDFIDTHCHLYLNAFNNDRIAMLDRARAAGIKQFYLPAVDSTTTESMLQLEADHDDCFAMMGLHPCSVNEGGDDELKKVESWLAQRKWVAVGEIGLDFYWDKTFTNQQYAAFKQQMEWALHYGLPIVIHSRNAMKETIETVRPFAQRGLRGIFHCFGEGLDDANAIIEMGFLLGVGGVLTYKKSGLDEVLTNVDLKHIVLETDAPYLAPVPHRGKRNESAYIPLIAERLAAVKGVSLEQVAEITTANAQKIFGG